VCGILGIYGFDGRQPDRAIVARHTPSLRHRGPDASAVWSDGPFAFGHCRLSIIDLGLGHQPMATPDGQLVVTFNGEIYNYRELRQALADRGHMFQTASDTEVLLHGYREWGTDLPAKLIGMFAFAIADRTARELFMARDRFGEKPLLYADRADGVVFASELGPIAALLGSDRAFNNAALPAYLCLNYVPGDQTLLKGVYRLRPGTWRLYRSDAGVRTGSFWQPPPEDAVHPTMAEAVGEVERLLDDAVRFALRSDVPVGIFLSGGIDSALIARVASGVGRLSHAFCLTFDEASYSEWDRAQATAQALGIPLTRVTLGEDAMAQFLALVQHADDPLADSSSLAVFTLAAEAARHVKVVLTGDGGDELFGGYLTYQATAWHAAATSRLPLAVRRWVARNAHRIRTSERKVSSSYKLMRFLRAVDLDPAEAHFTWNGVWLPGEAAMLLSSPEDRATAARVLHDLAAAHHLAPRPTLGALQRADVADYLPNDILAKGDRMTMAHGLEARAPFLNPALAHYALALPAHLKVGRTGTTKRVLRELVRSRFGAGIAGGAKQGFSIPVHAWLRGTGRALLEDLLSDSSLARIPELDRRAVRGVVDAHMAGARSLGFELWGLMVLAAWHRRHVQSEPLALPRSADAVQPA
jgi:asparagine synthase (glutamine-hydrolysing)